MHTATIVEYSIFDAQLSPKTNWRFLRLRCSDGTVGIGEVTCFGREREVAAALGVFGVRVLSAVPSSAIAKVRRAMRSAASLAQRVACAGLEMALIDILARTVGLGGTACLSPAPQRQLASYANINRGTADRSPDGHATRARKAVRAGYTAIKIAPFDEVGPGSRERIAPGVDRVAAVRDSVGSDVAINIDCHERFDAVSARAMIDALGPFKPFWIEDPIPETQGNGTERHRLRSKANDLGIRLAGGENDAGTDIVLARISRDELDVYLPDLRFCGGIEEALRIAAAVDKAGLEFSLHNPVGPVLDAVSRHVARVAPSMIMLERTFQEGPLQAQITVPPFAEPADPAFDAPGGPGWGIALNSRLLTRVMVPDARLSST